jgi:hypothetical protein
MKSIVTSAIVTVIFLAFAYSTLTRIPTNTTSQSARCGDIAVTDFASSEDSSSMFRAFATDLEIIDPVHASPQPRQSRGYDAKELNKVTLGGRSATASAIGPTLGVLDEKLPKITTECTDTGVTIRLEIHQTKEFGSIIYNPPWRPVLSFNVHLGDKKQIITVVWSQRRTGEVPFKVWPADTIQISPNADAQRWQ